MIRNICLITYIGIIILQSLFLGIEVQYLEKRDIHLCGGHSPPRHFFSLSLPNYLLDEVYYLVFWKNFYTFLPVIGLF